MTQSIRTPRPPSSPTSLVRTDLLTRATGALDGLDDLAAAVSPRSAHLRDTLADHHERLATRALSVGLAPIASAEELRDLACALAEVDTFRGWVARELRLL